MRGLRFLLPVYSILLSLLSSGCEGNADMHIVQSSSPQAVFAKQQLESSLAEVSSSLHFTMLVNNELGEQAFRIEKKGEHKVQISGGDETGLMYGGLELAERIRMEGKIPVLDVPIASAPFIKKRGLKFNIPLDIRTPSYQDAGDAAQQNIAEMWNFEFWKAYLDRMAFNRYNVLTLWNPHPFPSMIKLDNYPDIALADVCATAFPIDTDRTDEPIAEFIAGCGVSQQVMDHLVVLKKMTIEEKIAFWQKVMRYAKERGVAVYFITWNIKLNSVAPPGWYRQQELKMGDQGKYGINNDQENPRTIAYLRESVKEFLLTYPDVAGIGVTAGENMEDRNDQYDREKWLWQTYGEGVMEAKKEMPGRPIEFIHRFWQSGVDKIVDDFISKYPDPIHLSFKYARARMYATPDPPWADQYLEELKKYGLKSWWNIRNDDIFHFRWGDPEYASAFIKNLPPETLTAGYFMGSDGYVWGREFISKHPQQPRQLEVDKHWFNFMLWGRMGYDPDLPSEQIKGLVALRYPALKTKQLMRTWAQASKIPSLVTRFHWHSWDFQWAVEGCLDLRNGFHTVEDFINNPTMDGSGILNIREFVRRQKNEQKPIGITPLQHADKIEQLADSVLAGIPDVPALDLRISEEEEELLYDLKAWAFMGKYYASKIRGAYHLYAFREKLGDEHLEKAERLLERAFTDWKNYAAAADRNYRPQFLAKTRTVNWVALTDEVEKDLSRVKDLIKNHSDL